MSKRQFTLLALLVLLLTPLPVAAHDGDDHALAATSPTPSTLTIAPTAQSTITTPTVLHAGDQLKLDLSQFSSQAVTVTLTDEDNQTTVLADVPLLTDAIGFTVTIPDNLTSGAYLLTITGTDKGEAITVPVTVVGTPKTESAATDAAMNQQRILLIALILLLLGAATAYRLAGAKSSLR